MPKLYDRDCNEKKRIVEATVLAPTTKEEIRLLDLTQLSSFEHLIAIFGIREELEKLEKVISERKRLIQGARICLFDYMKCGQGPKFKFLEIKELLRLKILTKSKVVKGSKEFPEYLCEEKLIENWKERKELVHLLEKEGKEVLLSHAEHNYHTMLSEVQERLKKSNTLFDNYTEKNQNQVNMKVRELEDKIRDLSTKIHRCEELYSTDSTFEEIVEFLEDFNTIGKGLVKESE